MRKSLIIQVFDKLLEPRCYVVDLFVKKVPVADVLNQVKGKLLTDENYHKLKCQLLSIFVPKGKNETRRYTVKKSEPENFLHE